MGNGVCSRAIIKKGTLSYIEKPTIAGQCIYLLDCDRKVCCNAESGIWVDNSYYKCDISHNGKILIPYVESERAVKAVLLH